MAGAATWRAAGFVLGVVRAAGLCTRQEACRHFGTVMLGTSELQEDGAGRISLAVTPQDLPGLRGWGAPGRGSTRRQSTVPFH